MRGRVAVCVRRKGLGAEPLLCLAVRTRGERGGEERERKKRGRRVRCSAGTPSGRELFGVIRPGCKQDSASAVCQRTSKVMQGKSPSAATAGLQETARAQHVRHAAARTPKAEVGGTLVSHSPTAGG